MIALALILPAGLPVLISPAQHPGELAISLFVYYLPAYWGCAIALSARRRLAREADILRFAENRALEDLRKFQSRDHAFTVDAATHERFIPSWVRQRDDRVTPTTVRMVQSLCNDALGNRFPPISVTSQVYAIELNDGARRLRTPQTVALRLGILFTFIGLLISLAAVGEIFQQGIGTSLSLPGIAQTQPAAVDGAEPGAPTAQDRLRAVEPKIFQTVRGLTAAFGSSISGLVVAITLQGFVELLLQQQRQMAKLIEDTVGTLVNVLSLAQTGVGFSRSLEALEKRLSQHQDDLTAHAHEVRETVARTTEVLERQNNETRLAASALAAQGGTLSDLAARHQVLLAQLREGFDGLGELESKFAAVIGEHAGRLEKTAETIAGSAKATLDGALDTVRTTIRDQVADVTSAGQALDRAAQRVEGAAGELAAGTQGLVVDPGLLARLTDALDNVARELDRRPAASPMRFHTVASMTVVSAVIGAIGIGVVASATGIIDVGGILHRIWLTHVGEVRP